MAIDPNQNPTPLDPLVETLNPITSSASGNFLRVQRIVPSGDDPIYVTARAFTVIGARTGNIGEITLTTVDVSIRLEGDPIDEYHTLQCETGKLYYFNLVEIEAAATEGIQPYR